jgi:hypothetical protein
MLSPQQLMRRMSCHPATCSQDPVPGKNTVLYVIVIAAVMVLLTTCKSSSEPVATEGNLKGVVRSTGQGTGDVIHPAYLIHEDTVLAVTDQQGNFTINGLEAGYYSITCSAIGYRDTLQTVHVSAGVTNEVNFNLPPDTVKAKVRGEFQDLLVFNDSLAHNPELGNWDARQVFIGVTGATMHEMRVQHELPERRIFLGDSLVTISDDWGQYWFEVQCGTYPLRGACEGYQDDQRVFKVKPGQDNYLNFFLIAEMEE